jgi:hypothetical protein
LTQEVIAQQVGIAEEELLRLAVRLLAALVDTIQRQYQRSLPPLVFLAVLASSALLPPPITRFLANLDLSARTCSPLAPARLDFSKT